MKTGTPKNLKKQTLLATLTLAVGMLLMVFKIVADSEPGAIPLVLVLAGATWYFVARVRLRMQDRIE